MTWQHFRLSSRWQLSKTGRLNSQGNWLLVTLTDLLEIGRPTSFNRCLQYGQLPSWDPLFSTSLLLSRPFSPPPPVRTVRIEVTPCELIRRQVQVRTTTKPFGSIRQRTNSSSSRHGSHAGFASTRASCAASLLRTLSKDRYSHLPHPNWHVKFSSEARQMPPTPPVRFDTSCTDTHNKVRSTRAMFA